MIVGIIIFLLIVYVCLVGAYYLYKKEKTDISECPHDPNCKTPEGRNSAKCGGDTLYTQLFIAAVNSLVRSSPSFAKDYNENTGGIKPASLAEIMAHDPKFDVGGVYSFEKLHNWVVENYPRKSTDKEKNDHKTWQRNNCISVLKSKTKFKTNWLYFGDGF